MYVVYGIKNIYSGRVYIGSTVNEVVRRQTHFSHLRNRKHKNRKLQRDYNLYGESAFVFYRITKAISKETALKFEQVFIDGYESTYNILPKAGKARGRVHIQRTKDRMSEAAKGRVISEEQKAILRSYSLGRKTSDEVKKKMSEAHKKRYEQGLITYTSILKEYQVRAILEAVDLGFDRRFLSEVYGISYSAINHIVNGTTWRFVHKKYHEEKEASA